MLEKLKKLQPSSLLVISLLFLFVPLFYYYSVYVPSQSKRLTQRYTRLLSITCKQYEGRLNNINLVLSTLHELPQGISTMRGLKKFLDKYPELDFKIDTKGSKVYDWSKILEINREKYFSSNTNSNRAYVFSGKYGTRKIKPREWKLEKFYYVFFSFALWVNYSYYKTPPQEVRFTQGTFKLTINLELPRLADNFCVREEFDEYLLFSNDGEVIYRTRGPVSAGMSTGLRISRLDAGIVKTVDGDSDSKKILAMLGGGNKKEDNKERENAVNKLFLKGIQNTKILGLEIAGKKYKLFVQPLSLPVVADAKGSNKEEKKPSLQKALIGGVVSEDSFQSLSKEVSANWMLLILLLLVLLLVSYPIIKYFALSYNERFKIKDAVLLGLFVVFIIPIALYTILTAAHYFYFEEVKLYDLQQLGERLHEDFQVELKQAAAQLQDYILRAHGPAPLLVGKTATIKDSERYHYLFGEGAVKYPYFDMVAAIDQKGMQVAKHMVGKFAQPRGDVSKRNYFSAVSAEKYWHLDDGQSLVLDPVYSYSTGEYEISMAMPVNTKRDVLAAVLSIKPCSVMEPILPFGHEFAIVNRLGKVLFHSDPRLNSFENIFSECDSASNIEAALHARGTHTLNNRNYHGKSCNIFLRPIDNLPWTLIVMQERDVLASQNFIVNSIAMFSYLRYVLILIGLASLFGLLLFLQKLFTGHRRFQWLRLHQKMRWLWPQPRFSKIYLAIGCFHIAVFIYLVSQKILENRIEFGFLVIPFLTLLFTYTLLMLAIIRLEDQKTTVRIVNKRIGWEFIPKRYWLRYTPMVPVFLLIAVMYVIQSSFIIPNDYAVQWFVYLPFVLLLFWDFGYTLKRKRIQDEGNTRSKRYRQSYYTAILSGLLVLLVFPALYFWMDTYRTVSGLYVDQQQLHLALNYCRWEERRNKKFELQLEFANHEEAHETAPFSRLKCTGVYTLPSQKIKLYKAMNMETFGESSWNSMCQSYLQWFASLKECRGAISPLKMRFGLPDLFVRNVLMPNKCYRQICFLNQPQPKKSLYAFFKSNSLDQKHSYLRYSDNLENWNSLLVWSTSPNDLWGFIPLIDKNLPKFKKKNIVKFYVTTEIILIFLFITLGLYFIVRLLTRAVFLAPYWSKPDKSQTFNKIDKTIFEGSDKMFILGDPIKADKIKDAFKGEFPEVIDLESVSPNQLNWKFLFRSKERVIILSFGSHMDDVSLNKEKLHLLEKLGSIPDRKVLISSSYFPLGNFRLVSGGSIKKEDLVKQEEELTRLERRWKLAMKEFTKKYYFNLDDKDNTKEDKILYAGCQYFLNSDCKFVFPTPESESEETGESNGSNGKSDRDQDIDDFRERLANFVMPVYERIWKTCTREEKITLIHLAEDRLLNSKNKDTINQLLNRKLIKLAPVRLKCNAFRRFLLNVEDRQKLLEWHQKKVGAGIRRISNPFLFFVIGALVLLAVTQPTIFRSGMIVLPALASAIPAMLKFFDLFPNVVSETD